MVRPETTSDRAAIDALLVTAFPTPGEARLVHALRASNALSTSLVAEQDGAIVGHVAFSPVQLEEGSVAATGLGPVAVDRRQRRRGIAEALIRAGLEARREAGDRLVVVLGDPAYYARFGFGPARLVGLDSVYGGGDAFQAMALGPEGPRPSRGLVRYSSAFDLVADEPAEETPPPEHLAMIFAVAENGALGLGGQLPWNLPMDRDHFARTTLGHAVLMGRRTWEETGRALPGRLNIVVSRTAVVRGGAVTVRSLEEAVARAREDDPMPFVIGGARMFEAALPLATRIYETQVPGSPAADVFLRLPRGDFEEVTSWPGPDGERYRVLGRRGPAVATSR
jgi:putative acetyltransferase